MGVRACGLSNLIVLYKLFENICGLPYLIILCKLFENTYMWILVRNSHSRIISTCVLLPRWLSLHSFFRRHAGINWTRNQRKFLKYVRYRRDSNETATNPTRLFNITIMMIIIYWHFFLSASSDSETHTLFVRTFIHTHVRTLIHGNIYLNMHIHENAHTFMITHIFMNTNIHTHIHTHSCTQTNTWTHSSTFI